MKPSWMRCFRLALIVLTMVLVLGFVALWFNLRGEPLTADLPGPHTPSQQVLERGAYLARVGNCAACHTDAGGAAYAGGKGIATPFGSVFASNLTPDKETGIGRWTSAEFWRAMHHGQSKDGRLLYPAFPYPEYTRVTREDSDTLFAFLGSQPAVQQANRPHELRFPYNTQLALAAWRALFFTPAEFQVDASQSAEWNRGAYLVRGLAHCQACHAPRNSFGATTTDHELGGGVIPIQKWHAPSLASIQEAGVQGWALEEITQLLSTGKSQHGSALGPMAGVVYNSTQHWSREDLNATAVFLKQLPVHEHAPASGRKAAKEVLALGERIYQNACSQCHGEKGQGVRAIYPALASNRTVLMDSTTNLLRVIIGGGFLPSTRGNPQPFGMPPFGHSMTDAEIAAVASFIRGAWGNSAPEVSVLDVQKAR